MPWLGLGVWQIESDRETEAIVTSALEIGYRSIDTAKIYGNERGVGNALRSSGLAREQYFVTTKLWNTDIRSGNVERAFETSLKLLGLEYVDLYLVHWAIPGKIVSTWKAMERLQKSGRVKSIGVSNHMVPHLDELLASAEIAPAVNQVEYHPFLQSRELVEYCRVRNIHVEAWSPLMQGGELLKHPTVLSIGQRHRKTAAQVVLRWNVQTGIITIPKSSKPERLRENADIFDFVLTPEDIAAINALEAGHRVGPDPLNVTF